MLTRWWVDERLISWQGDENFISWRIDERLMSWWVDKWTSWREVNQLTSWRVNKGNKQGISLPSPLGEGLGVRPRGFEFVPSNPPKRTRQRRNNLFHRCLAMSLSEAVAATYLPWCSSETVSFLRPRARRAAKTRRPFFVDILSRKPCLFTLLRLWGWNVLFIALS